MLSTGASEFKRFVAPRVGFVARGSRDPRPSIVCLVTRPAFFQPFEVLKHIRGFIVASSSQSRVENCRGGHLFLPRGWPPPALCRSAKHWDKGIPCILWARNKVNDSFTKIISILRLRHSCAEILDQALLQGLLKSRLQTFIAAGRLGGQSAASALPRFRRKAAMPGCGSSGGTLKQPWHTSVLFAFIRVFACFII